MKLRHKILIHRINHTLNQPKAVIVVLLLLFAYFAHGNSQFNRQNGQLLANSSQAILQLNKVLCEGIPSKDCNLTKAVNDLKTDNRDQTVLLCKLFLTGRTSLDPADQAAVESICKERIQQFNASIDGVSPQASDQTQGSSASSPVAPSSSDVSTSPNSNSDNAKSPPDNSQPLLQVGNPLPKCLVIGTAKLC